MVNDECNSIRNEFETKHTELQVRVQEAEQTLVEQAGHATENL